jgi:hypothetical protein
LLAQALCFGIKPFSSDKHVNGMIQQLEEYLTPHQCVNEMSFLWCHVHPESLYRFVQFYQKALSEVPNMRLPKDL